MPDIYPIRPTLHLDVLNPNQRTAIKEATLDVLDRIGVRFPSDRALRVFTKHGAKVDMERQIVRLPPDLTLEAMGRAPRSYTVGGGD